MRLPLLEDLPDVDGRRVLLRADFNVPLTAPELSPERIRVADDFRIRATLPTIEWLTSHGAEVTACSHLGRPRGRPDPRYAMAPVRRALEALAPGVTLLENLRFDPGEEANEPAFVERLVSGQDAYVDDAFGAAHRAHASVVGPPKHLPSAAGRLLAAEVEALSPLVEHPMRPFVAVVGGAKVADKLGLLRSLLDKAEVVLVGGRMAFTFLVALGHEVGASYVETEMVDPCRELLDSGRRVMLPTDVVAASSGDGDEVRVVGRTIPPGWTGFDIGPKSSAEFAEEISGAGTVFWNGPMGMFEDGRFAAGTRAVAESVAGCGGYTVVGGGDSASALAEIGLTDRVDHVSTGGGASLELIERGDLPGLAALEIGASRERGSRA